MINVLRVSRTAALIAFAGSLVLGGLVVPRPAAEAAPKAAFTVTNQPGANAAAIQPSIDAFRTAIGGANNGAIGGSFPSGRREINWDGVPTAFSAPNPLPANFFNVNSPRGAVFSGPGTGFQVSGSAADVGAGNVRFGNINPTYPAVFTTFTAEKLFTPVGSNTYDVTFFVPGTNTPAYVSAFGAVFVDIDNGGASSTIQFLDESNGNLLGFGVLPAPGGFTFAAAQFTSGEKIARVRLVTGTTPLAAGTNESLPATDLVVLDDLIYAEPQPLVAFTPTATATQPATPTATGTAVTSPTATATSVAASPTPVVPETPPFWLYVSGAAVLGAFAWRRRR